MSKQQIVSQREKAFWTALDARDNMAIEFGLGMDNWKYHRYHLPMFDQAIVATEVAFCWLEHERDFHTI